MKNLVIGLGEIGSALQGILKCDGHDIEKDIFADEFYDILHICFPYSVLFHEYVKDYKQQFKAKYVVIHSTVPVGTSRKLDAINSPVMGIHPFMREGLLTFTKFLGGKQASEVADVFRRAGMKVYLCDKQETTELAKLSQTTLYALQIEYVKDFKRLCDKLEIPFSEAYTLYSQNYNEGYRKMGNFEYCLPLLTPILKPQGGHCTINNLELWETEFTKLIKRMNESNL